MTKDLTMYGVQAGQMAVMEPEVESKLEACAKRYLATKEPRSRAAAKREFYEEYLETYDEAVEKAFDPKVLMEQIALDKAREEALEKNIESAMDIGEGLAEIAFIKAVRTVAKVDSIDFTVERTHRDVLLEERAPHLARPRSHKDAIQELRIESTTVGDISPTSTPSPTSKTSISR